MGYTLVRKARRRKKDAMDEVRDEVTLDRTWKTPVVSRYSNWDVSRKFDVREFSEKKEDNGGIEEETLNSRRQSRRKYQRQFLPIGKIPLPSMESQEEPLEPRSLAEAIMKRQPSTEGFLPIAMPRPESPDEDLNSEPDYVERFNAPDHIEIQAQGSSEDEHTEVSDLSVVTDFYTGFNSFGASHIHRRRGNKMRSHLPNLENKLDIVVEDDMIDDEDCVELPVTDLSNMPDTFGQANQEITKPEPPDSISVVDRCSFSYDKSHLRGRLPEEADMQEPVTRSLKRCDPEGMTVSTFYAQEWARPRSGASEPFSRFIRETLSAEGAVIIDISDICEDDVESSDNKSREIESRDIENRHIESRDNDVRDTKSDGNESRDTRSMGTESRDTKSNGIESRDVKSREVETRGRKKKESVHRRYERETKDPPTINENTEARDGNKPKPEPSFVEFSLGYLESVASGINSHLQKIPDFELFPELDIGAINSQLQNMQKIDLFPDLDTTGIKSQLPKMPDIKLFSDLQMDEMLASLGRGLDETSKNIPKHKEELVELFREQIEKAACGTDRSGPMEEELKFPTRSIENIVEHMKTTYKRSVDCGLSSSSYMENELVPKLAPQTFMIPMSLERKVRAYERASPGNSIAALNHG